MRAHFRLTAEDHLRGENFSQSLSSLGTRAVILGRYLPRLLIYHKDYFFHSSPSWKKSAFGSKEAA